MLTARLDVDDSTVVKCDTTAHYDISVITVTRRRRDALARAIASVQAQTFPGRIEHLIVVDDDEEPVPVPNGASQERRVRLLAVPRPATERRARDGDRSSAYPRLSRLFNTGALAADAPWISFLDDDNEFEPDHLASLADCARRHDAAAVHSGRRIFWPDGKPYLDPVFPWAADVATGRRIHALLRARGVWIPGTNILLDQVDPAEPTLRNSTVMDVSDPTFLVDQSVWLLRRELVLRLPFPERYSAAEIAANTCPDDKFLEVLVRSGVPLYTTARPTVRYFLGGISNVIARQASTDSSAAQNNLGRLLPDAVRPGCLTYHSGDSTRSHASGRW
jgi:glycosyltransferase involved in cell wall biosynthesis